MAGGLINRDRARRWPSLINAIPKLRPCPSFAPSAGGVAPHVYGVDVVDHGAPEEDTQWQRLVRFWQAVGVNVVANLLAAAILYPLGALFGLLPRNRAAILTAALLLLLTLMVALHVVSRSRRVTYRLRERAWLAAWLMGVAGVGVGAYISPDPTDRKFFTFAAVGLLAFWVGILRQYRRGVPVYTIMSKIPRDLAEPTEDCVVSNPPSPRPDLPVGDRWRAWRAAHDLDRSDDLQSQAVRSFGLVGRWKP